MAKKNVTKSAKTPSRRIEVFRPGTFTAMSGQEVTYSADDLEALASAYDFENAPAPIVVGHPNSDSPAYGWVSNFEWDAEADRLYADLEQVTPAFSDAVQAGHYKRISMSFYKPDSPSNPKSGSMYPKHVGFLGGAAPAVPGLASVAFKGGDDEAVTIEFAESAFRDVANIFQKIREYLIETAGRETADDVVPGYLVNWIDDAADPPAEQFSQAKPKKGKAMSGKSEKTNPPVNVDAGTPGSDDFADREAELTAREKKLADQEAARAHADHEAFADQLISEGRMVSGLKPKVVALLDAAATDDAELSFAEGDETKKANSVSVLKDILSTQSKIVDFSETNMADPPLDVEDSHAVAEAARSYQAEQRSNGIEISTSDAVAFIEEKQGAKS